MFSLQNRYAFVQSLKPDKDKDKEVAPTKTHKAPKGSEKLPAFLRGLKGASKESIVHDTNAKTEDDKKKEAIKKVKRKKEDYIRFEV